MGDDKENITFDKKESAEIGMALSAGMAAIEFLQEITSALGLDPKSSTVDSLLERIANLIETEKEFDVLKDSDYRGEDQ